MLLTLWVGLVCVPEGGVEWDIQVITAEEVVIIRNDMDDRRRVVRLGLVDHCAVRDMVDRWLGLG